jgi:hypothetical protein
MPADDPSPDRPRVACVGPFHVDALAPALARRVLAHELAHRLPDADVSWWAPAARPHTARLDPLPSPRVGDAAHLRAAHDLAIVVTDAGTPSGDASAGTLTAPDLALLVPGVVPAPVRRQRRAHLATLGVLQPGRDGLLELAGQTGGACDVPDDATADDVVAAVEGARRVVTTDPAVAALAAAFGVAVEGAPPPVGRAADVAARLDALADAALAAVASRLGIDAASLANARARRFAHDAASARLAHERAGRRAVLGHQRLAERLQDVLHENDRLREEVELVDRARARAQAVTAELAAELAAIRATKTFRATAGLRAVYARLRRAAGR